MWISLSALWVPFPILVYLFANEFTPLINSVLRTAGLTFIWDADASRNLVNAIIAMFIGGPHMYATYSRTVLERGFSGKHKALLGISALIPILVVFLGVTDFRLLITIFFFWASIHIMHQIAFIMECYTAKAGVIPPRLSRFIDYAVVFSSLYPIATYKFVHDNFVIGRNKILFPDFLKADIVFYLVTAVFIVSAVMFIWKTAKEIKGGIAHYPKILLISLTSLIAFLLPAMNNLDVAFQGFNIWHSFQYLGLTYYINRLRHEKGQIASPFIDRMVGHRKPWRFYFFNVGLTFLAVLLIVTLIYFTPVLGLSFDQCYYIVVLSFLLVHYLHDHLLFTDLQAVTE